MPQARRESCMGSALPSRLRILFHLVREQFVWWPPHKSSCPMATLRKRTGKAAADEGVYSTSNKAASTDRTESWARSRMLGFASFVLPLSVIAVLCTERYGGAAATTIFHTEWTMEPVWKTVLYFALWASKEVLLNIFKYFLVVWAFGWSQEDYAQMIGPRHEWDGKEADRLVDKYGKYRTKIMDAINRRLGHNTYMPIILSGRGEGRRRDRRCGPRRAPEAARPSEPIRGVASRETRGEGGETPQSPQARDEQRAKTRWGRR